MTGAPSLSFHLQRRGARHAADSGRITGGNGGDLIKRATSGHTGSPLIVTDVYVVPKL